MENCAVTAVVRRSSQAWDAGCAQRARWSSLAPRAQSCWRDSSAMVRSKADARGFPTFTESQRRSGTPPRNLGLGDRGVRRRGGAGLDIAQHGQPRSAGRRAALARPLLARLQVEHAAAVGRALSARRAETRDRLLRRARRRAQPLVVEHDVECARPQRRVATPFEPDRLSASFRLRRRAAAAPTKP